MITIYQGAKPGKSKTSYHQLPTHVQSDYDAVKASLDAQLALLPQLLLSFDQRPSFSNSQIDDIWSSIATSSMQAPVCKDSEANFNDESILIVKHPPQSRLQAYSEAGRTTRPFQSLNDLVSNVLPTPFQHSTSLFTYMQTKILFPTLGLKFGQVWRVSLRSVVPSPIMRGSLPTKISVILADSSVQWKAALAVSRFYKAINVNG